MGEKKTEKKGLTFWSSIASEEDLVIMSNFNFHCSEMLTSGFFFSLLGIGQRKNQKLVCKLITILSICLFVLFLLIIYCYFFDKTRG